MIDGEMSFELPVIERTVLNKHMRAPGTWDFEPEIDRVAAVEFVWQKRFSEDTENEQ